MFTKFTQYITIIQYDPWTYPIQFLLFIVIAKDVKVFIQRKLNKIFKNIFFQKDAPGAGPEGYIAQICEPAVWEHLHSFTLFST